MFACIARQEALVEFCESDKNMAVLWQSCVVPVKVPSSPWVAQGCSLSGPCPGPLLGPALWPLSAPSLGLVLGAFAGPFPWVFLVSLLGTCWAFVGPLGFPLGPLGALLPGSGAGPPLLLLLGFCPGPVLGPCLVTWLGPPPLALVGPFPSLVGPFPWALVGLCPGALVGPSPRALVGPSLWSLAGAPSRRQAGDGPFIGAPLLITSFDLTVSLLTTRPLMCIDSPAREGSLA